MRRNTASISRREPPLRAHLFALGAEEHVLLLLLHHIAGDGWSLAPLARDLARYYEARCRGTAPALAALPVQYADYTLWQHEVLGAEEDKESAIARQLAFWTGALKGLPDQIELPSDRPRPARGEPSRRQRRLHADAGTARGLWSHSRAQAGRACSWCCRQRWRPCSPGSAAATTSRSAARSRAAPTARSTISLGFFVNTLVLRTDTSGNPSFRELVARVRAGNLAAYSHQELPFERLVEVINPARSLSRHPLFQVMLVLQNNAPVGLELPGLTTAFEPVASASAKFDLSVSLEEQRGADGTPAGIAGSLEYATDLFEHGTVEALAARLVRLLAAAVADADQPIGSIDDSQPRRAAHDPLRLERHRARDPFLQLAGAVRGAGRQDSRRDRGRVRGQAPHLQRARRALEPAGASSARTRGRTRGGGGAVRGALAGDARRTARHPQGRRRLSAARSGLSARAPRLHAGGCARTAAADAVRAHRPAAAASRPRRVARYRLAGDCGETRRRACPRPPTATPRLRHLHVGVDGRTKGRGGFTRRPRQSHVVDDGRLSRRPGRCRPLSDGHQLRCRRLGDLAAASFRRRTLCHACAPGSRSKPLRRLPEAAAHHGRPIRSDAARRHACGQDAGRWGQSQTHLLRRGAARRGRGPRRDLGAERARDQSLRADRDDDSSYVLVAA